MSNSIVLSSLVFSVVYHMIFMVITLHDRELYGAIVVDQFTTTYILKVDVDFR